MDLTQLANLGEFIGGVAVLVTLVYLAVQVRQNTVAINRSNVREVTREHVRAMELVTTDPELSDLMMRGWADLGTLEPLERYRFDLCAYAWLASVEQAFADHDSGHFPDDSMVIFHNNIPGVIGAKGGRAWWHERKVWFSRSFRDHVERLIEAPNEEAAGAGIDPFRPTA